MAESVPAIAPKVAVAGRYRLGDRMVHRMVRYWNTRKNPNSGDSVCSH